MLNLFKKSKSNEKSINPQLRDTIYKKVTKENHKHGSPKKNGDGTIKKCIELFEKDADPNVLSTLEKSLSEQIELEKSPEKKEKYQKHYKYYIENFLPALKAEVIRSEELAKPPVLNNERKQSQRPQTKRGTIVEIILEITNKNNNKDHSSSTIQGQSDRRNNQTDRQGNAMEPFNKRSFSGEVAIAESSGSSAWERDSLAKGVSGKGTSGTYNLLRSSGASIVPTLKQSQASKKIAQLQLNGSFSQSCEDLENKEPSTTVGAVEVPSGANTSKLSNDNGSDSGVSLGELSKESLKSPVSSRRNNLTLVTSTSSEESLNSTSNSVEEEDNGLQPEDEGGTKLAHLTKTRPKGPSGRRSPSKHHEKIEDQVKNEVSPGVIQVADIEIQREKNTDPSGQAAQMTGSQVKDSTQSKEKEEEAVSSKQEASKDILSKKQSNGRNLHVALVAGCALSTIGCTVAGVMTSGLVGAGLLAMAAVFAIAAVAELHSNFLSSKLTSINVSPLVDNKELTAL